MTVILPTAVGGSATGWTFYDYLTNAPARTDPAAASGVCSVQLAQLDPNELWLIDHAVVSCTSTIPTAVRWYADSLDPGRLLDGSDKGNFDVADWPAGLQLAPSSSLLVVWSGATAGAIGTVTLQGRVLRRL